MSGFPRSQRLGADSVVPVVLPHIIIQPDHPDPDTVVMMVNGRPVHRPIARSELGALLSHIIDYANGPVRIEVHQADGTVLADILTPHTKPPPHTTPTPGDMPTLTVDVGATDPPGSGGRVAGERSWLPQGQWGPAVLIQPATPTTTGEGS